MSKEPPTELTKSIPKYLTGAPIFFTTLLVFLLLCALSGCSSLVTAPPDATADNLSLTSANAPLPPEAYKARLSFAYEAPTIMHSREQVALHLLVRNLSPILWPYSGQPDGKYQIQLANRWLDRNETITDDARGSLPYDLRPGDEAEVLIFVTAPEASGDYILELDLVQEAVWFSQAGSKTLSAKIRVE